MRNFLVFIMGCIITSGFFYSCAVLDALKKVEDKGFICSNYDNAQLNQMNKQAVMDMVRNYYTNQYSILHNLGNTNNNRRLILPSDCNYDSRAVYFNLDTLKKLIYFIEKGSKGFSKQEKENLGVNFYFASYPETLRKFKHSYNYTNRHTLVMIPTIFDNGSKIARDIDMMKNLLPPTQGNPVYIEKGFYTNFNPQQILFGAGETILPSASNPQGMNSQNNTTGTPPPVSGSAVAGFNTGNTLLDITDPQ